MVTFCENSDFHGILCFTMILHGFSAFEEGPCTPRRVFFSIVSRFCFPIAFLIDFWTILPPLGAPFGVPLALRGRSLAHFGLQMSALGESWGAFGGT